MTGFACKVDSATKVVGLQLKWQKVMVRWLF